MERTDSRFEELCALAEQERERLHIPGAVVGVLSEGQEEIRALGVTNADHPLPVEADTLFQIGSITKTFVGTLIMRLVEQGRVDLETPIRTYLPELKLTDAKAAEQATLRHLLTHTGGWVGDYFDDFGFGEDALARMVASMVDLPQWTPLGEVWSYNNSGFYLAGRIIEVVTGKPFETAMQEMILDPLGMKQSYFFAHEVITKSFSVGHIVREEKPQVATPWSIGRAAHPAGGLICSAADLFRYARFHLGDGTAEDGTRLLSPEALQQMRTVLLPAGGISKMGLTWFITGGEEACVIGHGGATNGQLTQFAVVPGRGFAVATFTNANTGREFNETVVRTALKSYLGLEEPEAVPLESTLEELRPYIGRYDTPLTGLELTLDETGGLVLQVIPKGGFPKPDTPASPGPPPMRIALYAPDRAVVLDPPMKGNRIDFLRDAGGGLGWMRIGGRVSRRL